MAYELLYCYENIRKRIIDKSSQIKRPCSIFIIITIAVARTLYSCTKDAEVMLYLLKLFVQFFNNKNAYFNVYPFYQNNCTIKFLRGS